MKLRRPLLTSIPDKISQVLLILRNQFNDTAVDFVLGIGYKFDRGLNFNITYDIGFSNILIDEEALSTEGIPGSYYTWLEAQNRVIKVSVGMLF